MIEKINNTNILKGNINKEHLQNGILKGIPK
jgi:hypothetical protein